MWNPPIALSPEEQKMAARTQKTRKFSHSTGFTTFTMSPLHRQPSAWR